MIDSSLLRAAFASALESALSAYLALAPNRHALLEPLAGKLIALQVSPPGVTLFLAPTDASIVLLETTEATPDVTLSGSPLSFIHEGAGFDERSRVLAGPLTIDGDAATARQFRILFRELRIDWEPWLAKLAGNGPAGLMMNLWFASANWRTTALKTFGTNLAEFLQEERRDLPSEPETEAFLRQVDTLRADADRLELRLDRLASQLGQSEPFDPSPR